MEEWRDEGWRDEGWRNGGMRDGGMRDMKGRAGGRRSRRQTKKAQYEE